MLAFDSVNHEMEKYKQKLQKPEPTKEPQNQEEIEKRKIQ